MTLGGSFGIGAAGTHGMQQSELSRAVAPPSRKSIGGWGVILMLLGIGLLFSGDGGAIVIGVLIVLACSAWLWTNHAYNRDEYPTLIDRWNRSYMCQRCGSVYSLAAE